MHVRGLIVLNVTLAEVQSATMAFRLDMMVLFHTLRGYIIPSDNDVLYPVCHVGGQVQ